MSSAKPIQEAARIPYQKPTQQCVRDQSNLNQQKLEKLHMKQASRIQQYHTAISNNIAKQVQCNAGAEQNAVPICPSVRTFNKHLGSSMQ